MSNFHMFHVDGEQRVTHCNWHAQVDVFRKTVACLLLPFVQLCHARSPMGKPVYQYGVGSYLHPKPVAGLAVYACGTRLVVIDANGEISKYQLEPGFSHLSTFCINPVASPSLICFSATGTILATESGSVPRVVEVRLNGSIVRSIGEGVLTGHLQGVAACDATIAVTQNFADGAMDKPHIMLFDAATGVLLRGFATASGLLSPLSPYSNCFGIRFSLDLSHVVVAEHSQDPAEPQRATGAVSVFTVDGVLVKRIGEGCLFEPVDVEVADNGNLVVADALLNQVLVFAADSGSLVRSWSVANRPRGLFGMQWTNAIPTAFTIFDNTLYSASSTSAKVTLWE